MPIFLLVGGYSSALSWRSARRKDLGYAEWLRTRLRRLGIPLIALLLAWLVIRIVTVLAGPENATVQLASRMALIPTWYRAAYLMVILVAPPCLVLWERFGWWSIIDGIALAGAVDAFSLVADQPLLGYTNYLLVWAAFHQVGYAWLDGRLAGTGRRLLLAAIGLLGLLPLAAASPYSVSMITSAADEISNSSPTRVTMEFLGMLKAPQLAAGSLPSLQALVAVSESSGVYRGPIHRSRGMSAGEGEQAWPSWGRGPDLGGAGAVQPSSTFASAAAK